MSEQMVHNMTESLWDILYNSKMETEADTAKLRNYFMAPQVIDPTKKTIVFSTPLTSGGL
jgi:hypothetical protein